MTTFDVAHIRQQGQNMIIVPMRTEFGRKTAGEQANIEAALASAAHSAALAGQVVTVWDNGGGRMAFRGPTQWRAFLASISLRWVGANINKRITVK